MEKMIERVATMVQQMHGEPDQTWEHYADTAYAVLRDIREPTPDMVAAGGSATGVEAWKAMIDAALSEHADLDTDQSIAAAETHLDDDDSRDSDPLGTTGP